MSTNLSTSSGVILQPHIISKMAKAIRPSSVMGSKEYGAASDILNKGWKPFRPEPDTAACWDFTMSRGGPLLDLSPNNNDLTLSGGVVRAADGPFGWSYDFPGSDDYLYVADNPSSLQIVGELTIEVIYKADSIAASKAIISKFDTDSDNRAWQLLYDGTNLEFSLSSAGTASLTTVQYNDACAPVSTVLCVTAVYKPSAYMRLFINGSMVNEQTTSVPTSIYNSTENVTLGATYNDTTKENDFDGHMYMVRITPRAKSAKEVWVCNGRCY